MTLSENIFIIGLGGSGKSTTGSLLSRKIGYIFLDLDVEFKKQYGDIGVYVKKNGSKKYGMKNSNLFHDLLKRNKQKTIFALPPGFVVSKRRGEGSTTIKHLKLIKQCGVIVLLLPSTDFDTCLKILLKRQLSRSLGYEKRGITEDVKERFPKFMELGDIKIFSNNSPEMIVKELKRKLLSYYRNVLH